MRAIRRWAGLALVLSLTAFQMNAALRVSANKRFLVKEDGAPFLYLADTAWELFHRLNREEAARYLTNRAAKGFTVIQAVVLSELDGLKAPNAYGQVPLQGLDPAKPNEAYFRHVDYVVNKAAELGLYVGLLPTWGDKFCRNWGIGPEIFTPTNARIYGEFLGKRYRDQPIVWILGGDRGPENDQHLAIIGALAEGLKKGDGGTHLMTYHPQGQGNSSRWFHRESWLDFNAFQSGHSAPNFPNYHFALTNYNLTPPKPTLDIEARYEDHPINWKQEQGWFDDWDARQAAYWSMLAGACGHAYGNHNIWQFWQADRKPISFARAPWAKALEQPGAAQMGYLRKLFESRPWQRLAPDQGLLEGDPGDGADHVRAARADDGSFAFAYLPTGRPVTVALAKISGPTVKATWFVPRDGTLLAAGEFPNAVSQRFEPSSRGRGQDWVLVLDAAAKGYPPPGERALR